MKDKKAASDSLKMFYSEEEGFQLIPYSENNDIIEKQIKVRMESIKEIIIDILN